LTYKIILPAANQEIRSVKISTQEEENEAVGALKESYRLPGRSGVKGEWRHLKYKEMAAALKI
jgi:hypothetical protein